MSSGFVVAFGLSVVFIGLIAIILVCSIMSAIIRKLEKKPETCSVAPVASSASGEIPDRDKVVVAISAAIAEEIGESASAIRIKSLKRI